MNRYSLISLTLLISSTAVAGGRGAAFSLQNNLDRPARPSSQTTVELELVDATTSRDGGIISEIEVDGDAYTVEMNRDLAQSTLSLYGPDGDFVVGYVASHRGAAIIDSEGVVEQGPLGEISFASMANYGQAAMLLTDPEFLPSFLADKDVTFGEDDGPSAYWWIPALYAVARCADFSISYTSNSDGSSSSTYTFAWDC